MKYFHIGAWEAMLRTQLPKVMKLTAILLTICSLQVAAHSGAQITYQGKDVSLRKALEVVRIQGGVYMAYNEQDLDLAKPVTVTFKNTSVKDALDAIFKNQPLTYSIVNKTVFVIKKITTGAELAVAQSPLITVKGKVINEENDPVAGVTVMVKGTKTGTFTNGDGQFELNKVDAASILVLTAVNILSIEVNINGRSEIAIQVKGKTGKLDEVQVIAYGTTSQRFNTGNVSTVKASEIEMQPVNNPLLALQGRVPGLVITQNTGIAGGGITVRVQGQNSIVNGNDPLYVVDGVPYPSQLPRTGIDNVLGNSGTSNARGNPLSYINPADIESIDILKDADATAIYGSRAANGAILITTKKGKAGKTKFDLNMQTGWGKVARKLDMLNTRQYLDMRYEAYRNDGIDWTLPSVSANDLKVWDTTRYTDWQKALIGGTSEYTNINAGVSGGTSTIQYLLGGTYHKESTVFPYPKDFADEKGSIHFNLNTSSSDKNFRMQFSGNYMVDNNKLPATDITQIAVLLEPDAPPLLNQNGSINWAPNSAGASTLRQNPMLNLYTKYQSKTTNLISNLVIGYKILPGLEISNSVGYTRTETDDYIPNPTLSIAPEDRAFTPRGAAYGNRNLSSWIVEPQVNYKSNIANGKIDILVGSTILQNTANSGYLGADGHLSDEMLVNIYAAANIGVGLSTINKYRYNAVFGRINYNWQDKYIINLTARRDGSSRFGGSNRFHNFGSIGGAWLFSNERLFKNLNFLSFGKLRGSYGATGSDQIGDYSFMSLYNLFNTPLPYQGINSLTPAGLPNPHLQWEETRKIQIGLDIGLLKDRILLNLTLARNRSSNQLLRYQLPLMTGFGSQLLNFPATVQNTSLEFSINTTNIKDRNLTWTSGINLTIPRNKLVAFPNLATSTLANELLIGQPISIVKYYHLLGVDPTTGQYKYESKMDPFNPEYPDDYTVLINTAPKYYGGLQNTINYKGIQLDFLFQFVKQIGQNVLFWNGNREPGRFLRGFSNQPVTVIDRWQKPGDNATIKMFSTKTDPYFLGSDYNYSDASYIRLKNLSLSWQLPTTWVKKAHFQYCKIYVLGQNLLTITNYQGLDPENRSITALPPLRVVSIGLQVGL